MKTTEKIAFAAIAAGIAAALGLYWLADDGPWWVYAGVGVIIAALAYGQWVKLAADENMANKKD